MEDNRCASNDKMAKELANDISNFVNKYGFDMEAFTETIAREHKTIQQSIMRLFIATIRKMATVQPDARNAETVELAKRISEIADGYSLPLI